MRIAHITDIHVLVPPNPRQLIGKRALGSINLFLMGRSDRFSERVHESLVREVADQEPDLVICSGDITSQATSEEFSKAYDLLAPLFEKQPSVLIPGNHDTYTFRAYGERRIEELFKPWTQEGSWPRTFMVGDLAIVALDVCRASLLSTGYISTGQLQRLDAKLSSETLKDKSVVIVLHYPLRGHDGAIYKEWSHCLKNVPALEGVLKHHAERLLMILHGHIHHGFRSVMPSPQGDIPIFNPGSSGYAWLPAEQRTAHFNIYEVEGKDVEVKRFAYDGDQDQFVPESGGSYATGR